MESQTIFLTGEEFDPVAGMFTGPFDVFFHWDGQHGSDFAGSCLAIDHAMAQATGGLIVASGECTDGTEWAGEVEACPGCTGTLIGFVQATPPAVSVSEPGPLALMLLGALALAAFNLKPNRREIPC